MSRINVFVVSSDVRITGRDVPAVVQGIANAIAVRSDMTLGHESVLRISDVAPHLSRIPPQEPCALVLIGPYAVTEQLGMRWLKERNQLVVLHVDFDKDVQFFLRSPSRAAATESLEPLLAELSQLVNRAGASAGERATRMVLRAVTSSGVPPPIPTAPNPGAQVPKVPVERLKLIEAAEAAVPTVRPVGVAQTPPAESPQSTSIRPGIHAIDSTPLPLGGISKTDGSPPPAPPPLLDAAVHWLHAVLRHAVEQLPPDPPNLLGFRFTRENVLADLDKKFLASAQGALTIEEAAAKLTIARSRADAKAEPLAAVADVFGLSPLEFCLLILMLASELDVLYQRCLGLLLNDASRGVGTIGLYAALLGDPMGVRRELAGTGNLARWRVAEGRTGGLSPADESLRLDPFLAGWLLGEPSALEQDPYVRRALRPTEWRGARVLDRPEDYRKGTDLIREYEHTGEAKWFLYVDRDETAWRALLELGARAGKPLIRLETARLVASEEMEQSGVRLGRFARLSRRPLVLDVSAAEASPATDEALRVLFAAIATTGCRTGIVCADVARVIRLLGPASYVVHESAASGPSRSAMVRAAAKRLGVAIDDAAVDTISQKFPLRAAELDLATNLARERARLAQRPMPSQEDFEDACREVAAQGVSNLVERIDPVIRLEDVVLPQDKRDQLDAIVNNVKHAHQVLKTWGYGEKLPYGRGVAVMLCGASGTGKSMVAHGLADAVERPLFRIDISACQSKYVGETSKNLELVFRYAEATGAVILIDEADAILGKRSEVKDAHDRYANIEVAHLLQRIEAYDGLVILTTNMRHNIDPAFLRRLRFVIDFPRPDASAREKIWRQCLAEKSYDPKELTDATFKRLGRSIELSGGHIRQITLSAAFAAAAAGSLIRREHIERAACAELAKLGKPPVTLEPSPYLHVVAK